MMLHQPAAAVSSTSRADPNPLFNHRLLWQPHRLMNLVEPQQILC